MIYITRSESDTLDFGRALGSCLGAGDCVLLTGDLGAGKSVLARGIAAAHGVREAMPSPTFVLMIPYAGDIDIYHFDLYRLSDPDEFYQAGLEEYIGGDGLSIIEWPQMAALDYPGAVRVEMQRSGDADDECARRIIISGASEKACAGKLDAWRLAQ